jgi:carboxypeptidase family protein
MLAAARAEMYTRRYHSLWDPVVQQRSCTCLTLLALTLASARLQGQQIRLSVHDSATGYPVPGAVVSVLDSASAISNRAITDMEGRLTLALAPAAASVRVVHIGFRPRDVPIPPRVTGSDVAIDIAMVRLPTLLASVRVIDNPLCPGGAARSAAFGLWEQARAGLLAAVVARETKPAVATLVLYERTLAAVDDRVTRQQVQSRFGQTTRPFLASSPPAEFAARGYMEEVASERTFNAPDADVLLDDSFAATHCFRIERADAAHPDQVGLGFEPVARGSGRDSLVDVVGVLWLDSNPPALRSLEFRFTGLEPAPEAARARGSIRFRAMPNGIVFIDGWSMRIPVLRGFARAGTKRTERRGLAVAELREKGGEVVAASWPDSTRWSAPGGVEGLTRVTGRVLESRSRSPMPDALAYIEGLADTAVTDVAGAFTLSPFIPGRYTLQVADTALSRYLVPRIATQQLELRRDAIGTTELELPSIATLLAELCRGNLQKRTAIILGRVTSDDLASFEGIELRSGWQANYNSGAVIEWDENGRAVGGIAVQGVGQLVSLDAQGRFRVCGVARERPIRLRLLRGGARLADTTIFAADTTTKFVDWRLSRPVPTSQRPQ